LSFASFGGIVPQHLRFVYECQILKGHTMQGALDLGST